MIVAKSGHSMIENCGLRWYLASRNSPANTPLTVVPPTLETVTTTATHSLLDGLNPQQRAAVTHAGGPLLIVAGAGSGKTRVLTHRFAYPSNFSIYDSADSLRLMALVCRELELDARQYPPKSMAAQVSNLKNELIDYESFASNARGAREKALAEAYAEYQRRLVAAGAMDFDDLIMVTVNLFQAFPDVSEAYRRRFRHVLVDEYQDTNHAQYALVRELVSGGGALFSTSVRTEAADSPGAPGSPEALAPSELCVVGDADQSIYAFRGATIRN